MASSDLEKLAEAQRETIQALAELTHQLVSGPEPAATAAITGKQADAAGPAGGSTGLQQALESTSAVIGTLGQATQDNTQALTGLSKDLGALPSLLAGLAGGLQNGSGLLSGILGSGLGLASLGLKIAGLFGGGRRDQPAALSPFVEPPSLTLELANTDNILAGSPRVDAGQQGEVRTSGPQQTVLYQPQVTVNVSAMDSQSFLDRSGDIARAVREAMLHMHPVNDLISEL
ncbi:MAG: hypothetical protein HY236_13670 [Acidobacteria bacterium]|nr:hypothetical protein [Acidobacteriota bacterium]